MWGLTPIRQRVTTAPNRLSSSVSGPAEFIKLAQDVLSLPYIYFKRGLLQAAAIGASFDVRFFDIDSESINPEIWRRIEASPQFKQGQWLVAKHIVPVRPEDMDLISTDPDSDRVRLASMVQEMRVLAHKPLLSHRNIVDLIGFSWERSKDESGRKWPILIMEAADCGSLDDFLRMTDPSTKSPDFAVSMALDIASGLEALHSCGVVHGDLKPDNILIFQISSDTFRAKISDFGFACLIEDLKSESQNSNAHPVGLPGFSPPWEAPEASADVLLEDLTKMDVYTFGLLACYLAASGGDIFAEFRLDDSDTTYNFDQIASLKNDTLQMANHAKKLVSSWIDTGSTQGTLFSGTIDLSLCSSPKDRADMVEIRVYLDSMSGDEISDVEMSECNESVPLLPPDDLSLDEHVQYEDLVHYDRDLKSAASEDIVLNWRIRSMSEIDSSDSTAVGTGSQRLFWLSRSLLAGLLGSDSISTALEWLLLSASAGSTEAKASVYGVMSALKKPIPVDVLHDWLVDAYCAGEDLAGCVLQEIYPESYPNALKTLRTVYCGYGQDCFGELWRTEYPLDYLNDIVDELLEEGCDIDELHDYPGLVCGMTWLHYASSNGNSDMVQYLINKGANPNVKNDYGETPLFMACQAGHFEVVLLLLPQTESRMVSEDNLTTNELHFLSCFDQNRIKETAKVLLEWGADINQRNNDRKQTPLAFILNQQGPNCEEAVRILLEFGADPLIKDYHGLDCLAHAACQLFFDLMKDIMRRIPLKEIVRSKTDALCFVLEVDNYTVLVNGGEHYADKVEEVVKLLINAETSLAFQEITGHSALTFACANASLPVLNCLVKHLPVCDFTHWRPSAKEWYTPLMAAVVQDRTEVVEYLLGLLIDPLQSHPVHQWTPLFYAVSSLPQISSLLIRFVEHTISREAAISYVNRRDTSGATAFDIAVAGEFFEAAQILADYQPAFLAYCFPYGPESDCLMNSLGSAAAKRRQLVYLLDLIGPVNELPMVDNEGTTILHAVCGIPIDRAPEAEAQEIVDCVLARFGNPTWANCLTVAGETPLHFAARFGNIYAIQRLEAVYTGSLNWNLTHNKGWTALDEAESRKYQDISGLGYVARAQFRRRTEEVGAYLFGKGVRRYQDRYFG